MSIGGANFLASFFIYRTPSIGCDNHTVRSHHRRQPRDLQLLPLRLARQQLRLPTEHDVALGLPVLAQKQPRAQAALVLAVLLVHLPAGAVLAAMASSSAWSLTGFRR